MMKNAQVTKRPAAERGTADHGWLQARFTFSFAGYFDPDHMGFHSLRVMNNDTIQAGGGFNTHPHDNMEIFTYVLEGELEHRDSMGNGAVIKAGDLQYMSAGSGVTHSEFNPSDTNKALLYQIWLTPNVRDGEPRYAEKPLGKDATPNELHLLFSGSGRNGSTEIRQNAEISFAKADAATELNVAADEHHPHVWVQVLKGAATVFGESLSTGDGVAAENAEDAFNIQLEAGSEILLFRLAD